MNYEQKYKEALKRTMNLALTNNISALAAGEIFPELMESEDEKIRKEILEYFQQFENEELHGVNISHWISWLEKQDEKSDYNPYKATVESIAAMVEKYAPFDSNLQDFYDNVKVKCKDAREYEKTWLEKQGEQKPTTGKSYREIFPKFSVGDTLCRQGWSNHTVRKVYVDNITTTYVCENEEGLESHIDISEQDEWNKIEQNHTEKVEQKFKVGDWIINNDKRIAVPTQILKIEEYGYLTSRGYTSFAKVKTDYHLWTIQDAKDGDVLANKDGAIFINAGNNVGRTLDSYCYLSVQNKFCIEEHRTGSWFYKDETKPATKEQCDILFQKMKEAGYEWDNEKKELKKIEENPIDLNTVSIQKLVDVYRNTNEYDEYGNLKGKPLNCMIRAYEQGIRDILTIKQKDVNLAWSK